MIEGNFALLLFLATLVTGLYWVADRFIFLPRRRAVAESLQTQDDRRRADLAAQGIKQVDSDISVARERSWRSPGGSIGRRGCFPSS